MNIVVFHIYSVILQKYISVILSEKNMETVLNVQDFKGPNNQFILKKLAMILIDDRAKGTYEVARMLFKPMFHGMNY